MTSGIVAFFALNGLSLTLFGLATYQDYYQKVLPHLGVFRDVWLNSSINGYWHKLFDSRSGNTIPLWHAPVIAQLGTMVSCMAVVAVAAYLSRRAMTRNEKDLSFSLTLNGMLLVSPITWEHYFYLLSLPLLVLWHRIPRHGFSRLALQIVVVVLSIDPKVLWEITIPGVGERQGQVANPLQTLVAISYMFYAQLALFVLIAIQTARSIQSSSRK